MELVSWQPPSLAHRVAQTPPILLVGGTGHIPLRLGMGNVVDGSHKPVVIPTLGETMCILTRFRSRRIAISALCPCLQGVLATCRPKLG